MRVCTTRILSLALTILLTCTTEPLFAISGQQSGTPNAQSGTQTESDRKTAAAVAPVPEEPQPQQDSSAQSNPQAQSSGQQPSSPEGTATARSARTLGGPASKPAGSAIAPAKQHQRRSLLIKIGAIAGAGAALGTVYALTRGTPSRPPGAH
jgi:hypothetical protein